MKKETLIFQLDQVKLQVEAGEYGEDMAEKREMGRIKVIDILLDYINQPGVREKVEEIPL